MRKWLITLFFALFFAVVPTVGVVAKAPVHPVFAATIARTKHAAVVAKKTVKKTVKSKKRTTKTSCARCRSRAEGADNSVAAHATSWTGTVIGINEGERSYVISEARALNHIKAYAQRSVRVADTTAIATPDGVQKDFSTIDIGYRISVTGSYDAKKRIIHASSIEIVETP